MVELDGDDVRISSRGKLAERDIVQVHIFVYLYIYEFMFVFKCICVCLLFTHKCILLYGD